MDNKPGHYFFPVSEKIFSRAVSGAGNVVEGPIKQAQTLLR
jgi:hypothetical protein